DPNHGSSYQNLGTALKDLGRLPEATEAFRQAVRCQPQLAEAQHNLAIILKDQGLRSEEHTSELQSLAYLVCRLLLEKKKMMDVKRKNVYIRVNSKDTKQLRKTKSAMGNYLVGVASDHGSSWHSNKKTNLTCTEAKMV